MLELKTGGVCPPAEAQKVYFRDTLSRITAARVNPHTVASQSIAIESGVLTIETALDLVDGRQWSDRQSMQPVWLLDAELAFEIAGRIRDVLRMRGDLPKPRLHSDLIIKLIELRSENADSQIAFHGLNELIVLLGKADVDAKAAG